MAMLRQYKGQTYSFPDGTSDEKIKDYFRKIRDSQTSETRKRRPTALDALRVVGQGATLGFSDEALAGLRSAFSDRTYDDLLKEERDRLDTFKEANPKTALALELAGGLATPVTRLGLIAKAPTLGKKAVQLAKEGFKVGSVYGAGTGEGGLDRAEKAFIGGTTGLVANPVLSKTLQKITPKITDEAQKVMDRFGVKPSASRQIGGLAQKLEEKAESIPLAGDLIRKSRIKQQDKAVNRLVNESVKKIDDNKTIDKNLNAEKAIEKADTIFDDAYDSVLPKMNITNRQTLQSKVNQTLKNINNEFAYLSKAQMGKVKRDFQKITQLGTKEKGITGEQLQRWNTDFNKLKKNYEKDPILQDVAHTYFNKFKKEIYELATTDNPEVLTQWSKIQKGYSDFGTFADLVKKQRNITPRNIEKQARVRGRKDQAEGAKNIRQVFTSSTPDSGTAERFAQFATFANPKLLSAQIPALLYNPALSTALRLGQGESARVLPGLLGTQINNPQGLLE